MITIRETITVVSMMFSLLLPAEPYAGIAGKRMGSSTMRRYTPLNGQSGNIRKNGAIANRVVGYHVLCSKKFSVNKLLIVC